MPYTYKTSDQSRTSTFFEKIILVLALVITLPVYVFIILPLTTLYFIRIRFLTPKDTSCTMVSMKQVRTILPEDEWHLSYLDDDQDPYRGDKPKDDFSWKYFILGLLFAVAFIVALIKC